MNSPPSDNRTFACATTSSGTAGFCSIPVRKEAVRAAIRTEPARAVPSDAPNWLAVFWRPPTSGLSSSGTADTVTAPSWEARPPKPSPISNSGPVTIAAVASTSIAVKSHTMPTTTTMSERLTTRQGRRSGRASAPPRRRGAS